VKKREKSHLATGTKREKISDGDCQKNLGEKRTAFEAGRGQEVSYFPWRSGEIERKTGGSRCLVYSIEHTKGIEGAE